MLTCVCRPVSSSFIENQSIMGAPIDRDQAVVTQEPKNKSTLTNNQKPKVMRYCCCYCYVTLSFFISQRIICYLVSNVNLVLEAPRREAVYVSWWESTLKRNQCFSLTKDILHYIYILSHAELNALPQNEIEIESFYFFSSPHLLSAIYLEKSQKHQRVFLF